MLLDMVMGDKREYGTGTLYVGKDGCCGLAGTRVTVAGRIASSGSHALLVGGRG